MRVIGNHGKGSVGHGNAAANSAPAGFGYCVAIGDEAGDVGVIQPAGLQMILGRVNLGLFLQVEVPVTFEFTLSPEPEDDSAIWGSKLDLTPSDIKNIWMACTGIRLKFSAPGRAFLGVL